VRATIRADAQLVEGPEEQGEADSDDGAEFLCRFNTTRKVPQKPVVSLLCRTVSNSNE